MGLIFIPCQKRWISQIHFDHNKYQYFFHLPKIYFLEKIDFKNIYIFKGHNTFAILQMKKIGLMSYTLILHR